MKKEIFTHSLNWRDSQLYFNYIYGEFPKHTHTLLPISGKITRTLESVWEEKGFEKVSDSTIFHEKRNGYDPYDYESSNELDKDDLADDEEEKIRCEINGNGTWLGHDVRYVHRVFKCIAEDRKVLIYVDRGSQIEIMGNEEDINYYGLLNDYKKHNIDNKELKRRDISLISLNGHGDLILSYFKAKETPLNFDNYNDGFEIVNERVKKFLVNKESGLILLHGKPGTGKTTYIRHLAGDIAMTKNLIYVNNDMIETILSPRFIPFMMNNTNSILLIEDAEMLLRARDSGDRNIGISNILNLTDGLLSDCLNIKILCTFNCDIGSIDEALRRKGRLHAEYEFKHLEDIKVMNLFEKLGRTDYDDDKKYTLADIYNVEENIFSSKEEKTQLGF